jgi:hypothetical protein
MHEIPRYGGPATNSVFSGALTSSALDKPNYYIKFGQKKIPLLHRQTLVGRNPNALLHVEDHTIAKDHAIFELDELMANPILM